MQAFWEAGMQLRSNYWSLLTVAFLLLLAWKPSTPVSGTCLSNQSTALLRFREGLLLQRPERLISWHNGSDCCNWEGVTCDGATGLVVGLELSGATLGAPDGPLMVNSSRIDPSLFRLFRLHLLDLSNNRFDGPIPSRLVELRYLTHLNLSNAGFSGQIPSELSRMTSLASLDLSVRHLTSPALRLYNLNLTALFKNLSRLRILHLDGVNISMDGVACFSIISSALPNLQKLSLSKCSISGPMNGSILRLTQLQTIDLSFNNLSGRIPPLTASTITQIDLSANVLSGPIPESFGELVGLTRLSLHNNLLSGQIPSSLLNLPSLKTVDHSQNNLTGSLSQSWLWSKSSLQYLNLSHNMLTSLEKPMDVGNTTSSLVVLDLHSNLLGPDLPPFPPKALFLDFSFNKFTSSFPLSTNSASKLLYLSVSNNYVTGMIPESLCNSTSLNVLALSNNSLVGSIPHCLANLSELSVLNLRKNQLTGTIPDGFSVNCSLKALNLKGNQLSGKLPKSLCNCSSLEVLDLSNNNLTGGFPTQLGCLDKLWMLALRSNHLNGPVVAPVSGKKAFPPLQIIDISCNNFSGTLDPWFLELLTAMTKKSPNGTATLLGFPFLGNIYYPDTVAFTFNGMDFQMVDIVTGLTSIDLSSNLFSGEIPEEIGKLAGLHILNVSRNSISGSIPKSMGNLVQLECLDLSSNSLSGSIPQELANLTFLSVLNLSFNDLQGKIPETGQLATFNANSFTGNPGLCGPPLNTSCTDSNEYGARNLPGNGKVASDPFVYIAAEMGFFTGLAAVLIPLFAVVRVRNWWCGLVDRFVEVSLKKLRSN